MYIEVSDRFKGSGMDVSTFRMLAAENFTDKHQEYYTPYAIRGFPSGALNYDLNGIDGLLHEMSHSIDFFRRGMRDKLLQDNFGFGKATFPWKDAYLRNELRVITLQSYLGECLFDKTTNNYAIPASIEGLRAWLAEGVYSPWRDDDYYFAQTDLMMAEHRGLGFDTFIKTWNDLCAFVRENRVPQLRHLDDQMALIRKVA
jgi:hypothetical protein